MLRHSAAHVLATAVRRLRPDAKIGFGPAIEDGFYYDFEVAQPFTPEDLAAFEAEMRKVVAEKYPFVREEVDRARSAASASPTIRSSSSGSSSSATTRSSRPTPTGRSSTCAAARTCPTRRTSSTSSCCTPPARTGAATRSARCCSASTARRGSRRTSSTRICIRIEEAKKRDHRVLGKRARPVHVPSVLARAPCSGPSAARSLYNALVDFIRERQRDDFHEIKTPLLYNKGLWEMSGHWGKYRENMFLVLDNETGEHDFSLKPMNCPSHYLLYHAKKHSYRELPLRYVTFDVLHRNEVTGALSGLTRVRQFQQDDCHVFLARIRSPRRCSSSCDFILGYYETFGLTATLKFATRPEVRIGTDEMWDRAEAALRAALEATGMDVRAQAGRRRVLRPEDRLRRHRLDRPRVAARHDPARLQRRPSGSTSRTSARTTPTHRPVVIHRAVSGSLERFIAILIEHFAGAFPVWLAPEQVRVLPITDEQAPVRGAGRRADA